MTLYFCPRCDEGVWYGIPHRCLPLASGGTASTNYTIGYKGAAAARVLHEPIDSTAAQKGGAERSEPRPLVGVVEAREMYLTRLESMTTDPVTLMRIAELRVMYAETCHCGEPVAYGFDGDPTHHRGMCSHCDAVRCDAYPGECER